MWLSNPEEKRQELKKKKKKKEIVFPFVSKAARGQKMDIKKNYEEKKCTGLFIYNHHFLFYLTVVQQLFFFLSFLKKKQDINSLNLL